MPRLTLRTLLAYLDDTLDAAQAHELGQKVAESPEAQQLIERIKRVTRRRSLLPPPVAAGEDAAADPNTVAAYLDNNLPTESVRELESECLKSDALLAEVAACHQILTLVLTEPVRVPPAAYQRMYRLVPQPLADHNRLPAKAAELQLTPPATESPETEEADTTLLMGLKQYNASSTRWERLAWLGGVLAACILLSFSIVMALPRLPEQKLPVAQEYAQHSPAATETPSTPGTPKKEPSSEKHSSDKPPSDKSPPDKGNPSPPDKQQPGVPGQPDGKPVPPPDKPPPHKPPPIADDKPLKVLPPLRLREVVGKLAPPGVLLTRPADQFDWKQHHRGGDMHTDDVIVALPGYKADIELDTHIRVHLWGNLPEQYSAPLETPMDVRLRFHSPPKDFDADITLERGRIYLTASPNRTGPARIRLRLDREIWDIELLDPKTEILVQLTRSFVPGTPYARSGGETPRVVARLAVVRGQATVRFPERLQTYNQLNAPVLIRWDSKRGPVDPPQTIRADDPSITRFMPIPAQIGQEIQKALAETVPPPDAAADIRIHLESRLDYMATPVMDWRVVTAIYSYAAITEGPNDAVATMVSRLYDLLADRNRDYARRAAVTAVSAWLAWDLGNTKLLWDVMTQKKQLPEEEADLILRLLRGYSAANQPDAVKAVDDLVGFLNHPNLVVRETALGNLIAFFDPAAVEKLELVNVPLTLRGEPVYDKFLKNWQQWAEEFKIKLSATK